VNERPGNVCLIQVTLQFIESAWQMGRCLATELGLNPAQVVSGARSALPSGRATQARHSMVITDTDVI
jgi:hypothetical protein